MPIGIKIKGLGLKLSKFALLFRNLTGRNAKKKKGKFTTNALKSCTEEN